MANAKRSIIQYRFFGEGLGADGGPSRYGNMPQDLGIDALSTGKAFAQSVPIVSLGIQALPGTFFYFNDNLEPGVVGASGIYELDLTDTKTSLKISKLRFDITSLLAIQDNPDGYLLIDIVYEEQEKED